MTLTNAQQIANNSRTLVGDYFERKLGKPRELGYYIWDGIEEDCNKDWSEQRFMSWVAEGELKYGMTIEDYQTVNNLTYLFIATMEPMSARIKV